MCTLGTLLKINLTYSFLYIDTRPKPLPSLIKASVNRLISWRRYFYMSSQCDHTVINPFPSHQYLCICLFCWVAKDQTCFEHWTRDIGPSSGNSFGEPGRCTCLMAITSGWASASCWFAPGRGLLREDFWQLLEPFLSLKLHYCVLPNLVPGCLKCSLMMLWEEMRDWVLICSPESPTDSGSRDLFLSVVWAPGKPGMGHMSLTLAYIIHHHLSSWWASLGICHVFEGKTVVLAGLNICHLF